MGTDNQQLLYVSQNNETTRENTTPEDVKENDKEEVVTSKASFFDARQDFEIISFEQSISGKSSSSHTETACDNWSVAKDKCKELITTARVISGVEWHHSYDVLPCIYAGEIKQGENTYQYEFNSGDWFVVYSADSSIYLANGEPEVNY